MASRYQQWLAHRTHSQNGGLATSTTDLSLPLTKCLPANDTVKETTGACAALYSPAVAYSATLPQPGEAKLSVPPVPSQQCPSSKPVASLRAGENSPPTPAEETPFTATENTPFTENAPFTATENTLLTATKNTLFTEKTPATKKTQLTATEKTPATENTPFTATENKPLVASEKSSHQTHSSLGTPHQTQSLAVQSLQGSECTLLSPTHSHTPTGKTRERSGYDTSAIMTSNTLENQTLPLTSKQGHSHTFQATLTELHSVGQSSSSGDDGFTESQGLLHQSVHVRRDSEENESSQEQVGKTSGSVSGLSRGTVGETKATDSTPPGQISGGKGDKKPPSDMSSSDGGGGESPPLPRDTVSQRESGESSKESDGSSTSADSGDGLEHSTAHVGIDKSKSHQERAQTTEQTTDKVQSDKDGLSKHSVPHSCVLFHDVCVCVCYIAYASFLLSVRQTAAMTAAPLLDSDSEGVEDEVAGHQSRVSDESSASISPGRAAGSEVPQAK